MLVSTSLAPTLQSAKALKGTAIPGHAPAVFKIALEAMSQCVTPFVKPPPVEIPLRDPDDAADLASCQLAHLETPRGEVLRWGDVDKVWGFWTLAAEEVLLALSQPGYNRQTLIVAHRSPQHRHRCATDGARGP